jgi:tetratricopeptide (TPR) repeat protein
MTPLARVILVSFLVLLAAVATVLAASPTAELVTEGRRALDADKVDDALSFFERAVAADAKDPAALAWLGSAQVRKAGKVPQMEAAAWVKKGFNTLDQAVEVFPNAFVGYMVRGITGRNVPEMFNKTNQAVSDLKTVVTMREKNAQAVPDSVMPVVFLNLGLAYKKAGKTPEARAAWEQGKKAFPSAPETKAIENELRRL